MEGKKRERIKYDKKKEEKDEEEEEEEEEEEKIASPVKCAGKTFTQAKQISSD
jgi:hypothetical protein